MGEEVKITYYHYQGGAADEDERVTEWEIGLPTADDLTPLSQSLISPELASAFSISPEPHRTLLDVNRASQNTISAFRGGGSQPFCSINFNEDPMPMEADDGQGSGSDSRKLRKIDCAEEADSTDDPSARTLKRSRLVWTPQLHKRFVDVVAHLGIKNAVPKTIMQLMNVEGLTRENVASHLQKYRLYLKRMQGLSNDGPSSSDHLFASTPVSHSLHDSAGSGHLTAPIPMPYPPPMMPMPILGMPHMGMPHGFDSHPFNTLQQRDWSANKYASAAVSHSYPRGVAPNDN